MKCSCEECVKVDGETCQVKFGEDLHCQLPTGHKQKYHQWQDKEMRARVWPLTEVQKKAREKKLHLKAYAT